MRYAGRLGGGTPTIIKYQAGETFPSNGIPAEVAGGGGSGLQMVETNTALQVIGLALDSATISNAQASDGSTTSRLLSVVVNPDAILRSKLSGSATNDTAITAGTVDTANTDGLACSTDVSFPLRALMKVLFLQLPARMLGSAARLHHCRAQTQFSLLRFLKIPQLLIR